jgi:zinc protease
VVALSCFVTTGGRTEDEYYQGSLHYIEHLVYKGGTPNLAPTEFRKKISLLGREAGGWTWDDEINFGFEVPKENFREALTTFREAMLDLQYEEEWFEDEKEVVLQEMTRGREQPGRLIYEIWNTLAFDTHPYGRTVIGTEKAIRELEMTKTEQYYRDRFSPNHMLICLVGDFEPDEMKATIQEIWGAEEPGPESFELGLEEAEQTGPRFRTDHLPQATRGILLTGVVTPGGYHDDVPALELLAALMNDRSYGLPQYLTEQEKWVNSVYAAQYTMRDYGTFRVYARMDPEKLDAVLSFANAFLLDFQVSQIPESIFEQARRRLLFDEAQQRASFADMAERIGFLTSRRGQDNAKALIDRYEKLTPDDVQAAKERWLGSRRLVTAVVVPEDFDPETAPPLEVQPGAPFPPPVPDLDVAGSLREPDASEIPFVGVDEADGVTLFTYANGLRLLVHSTDASPLLGVSGRVLGGQWVEPKGQEGINRFTAEMGMRTTRRWNREGFTLLQNSLSIDASAHTSLGSRANTSRNVDYRDSGAHHYTGLADQWPEMLAMLKESLFFPEFDPDEAEKLRTDLLNEIESLPENNLEYIKQEFYVAAYGDHPYGRPTCGTKESIEGLGLTDIARFHTANWTPDRTVIAVVGDVDPEQVAEWIGSRWADLARSPALPWQVQDAVTPSWDPPGGQQTLELGKDYWTVNWGRPGCGYADDAYWPSVVLSRISGNDHFYKYVYGEGVSYRSWIRYWENLGAGTWILENDVKRERFDEILGMFDEDLVRYSTTGFTEQEYQDAVTRLVNSHVLDRQDNARFAWRLAVEEGNGVGFRRVTQAPTELHAVTHAQVQELAQEVFAPESVLRMVQQ